MNAPVLMAIVGIDLGTTNSLVAILDAAGTRTLANEFGEHLIPSVVAVAEDGAVLVGRAAKDRLVTAPSHGQACFKRDMGTECSYRFGGRTWSAIECSALVLRELKRIAEHNLSETVTSAVISVPAYFHDSQRHATIAAAGIAGLKVERIINEPTAAALAFGYAHRDHEAKLLVFDLGGGTFDVTVLEVFSDVIEVKASGGESRLGGEDYTDALLEHLITTHRLAIDAVARGRLRPLVEVVKRQLASQPTTTLIWNSTSLTVTIEEFARCTANLNARFSPVVRRCLRDADLKAEQIDEILLVGGASRMGAVSDYIESELGRKGNRTLDPDRVIALGAAVQAALCERSEGVRDMVLTDVCPHSLGVAVAKNFSPGQQQTGFFSPIIDRNTTVPVSRMERYTTLHPQQDAIVIEVFQGESRITSENTLLGTMRLSGLNHRPGEKDGGIVELRFTYDMNGLLEVDATVVASGIHQQQVIESRPGSMTPQQISEAIKRLQPLKLRPRDLLPNRARLERANRLYLDLKGEARNILNSHLDDFEAALETQDHQRIVQSAAVLDSFMAHFYSDEGETRPDAPDPIGA
jgi:molecular chaperone HscC